MPEALRMFIPLTKVDATQRLVYGVATGETLDRSGEVCDYASTKPFYEKWSGEIAKATGGKSLGNVRAMHGKVAAGKVTTLSFNDDAKQIEIAAKIVDDAEWQKVVEGVYTGFSQGGGYVKRWKDDAGNQRYTADPSEVSLVDLPCLPEATFQVIKSAGAVEDRHFKSVVDVNPSNAAVTEKAEELAKVAGRATEWASFIEPAREALMKAALPAPPEGPKSTPESPQSTPEGSQLAPSSSDGLEQVWKARDGKTFAKKADAVAHNAALDAAVAMDPTTKGVMTTLEALAEKLGVEKSVADAGDLALAADAAAANRADVTADAARRAAPSLGLAKGLPTVARLAGLIEELTWVKAAVHMEARQENDGSTVPAELVQNITDLCATLNHMCTEETAELIEGQNVDDLNNVPNVFNMAAGIPRDHLRALVKITAAEPDLKAFSAALEKRGARNSQADMEKIQAMHDNACDLGATCDGDNVEGDGMENAVKPGDLAKAVSALNKATAERDELQKTISEAIMPMLIKISERVEKIEKQPLPLPLQGGHRVVSKGGNEMEDGDVIARLADMQKTDPEGYRLLMIKMAQQQPQQMILAR